MPMTINEKCIAAMKLSQLFNEACLEVVGAVQLGDSLPIVRGAAANLLAETILRDCHMLDGEDVHTELGVMIIEALRAVDQEFRKKVAARN